MVLFNHTKSKESRMLWVIQLKLTSLCSLFPESCQGKPLEPEEKNKEHTLYIMI